MKKVFLIHGFGGTPNGGWRPWLMRELESQDIYACALPMSTPDTPVLSEWLSEVDRYIEQNKEDELYLVGHSLGATTILRYLESSNKSIEGVILVSGPIEKTQNRNIDGFLETDFDFEIIKSKAKKFVVIHGDNDPNVPLTQAETTAKELGAELMVVKNGGHLNGSAGYTELLECLQALEGIMS